MSRADRAHTSMSYAPSPVAEPPPFVAPESAADGRTAAHELASPLTRRCSRMHWVLECGPGTLMHAVQMSGIYKDSKHFM